MRVIPRRLSLPLLAAALMAALPLAPHLALFLRCPGNAIYCGNYFDSLDYETYIAKMRIPAELGGWLWRNWYDPNFSGPGAPLFLFYAFLGKAAHALGVGYPAMFALARAGAAATLAAAAAVLARELGLRRPWVPLLAVLGGGLEWLAFPQYLRIGVVGPEAYLSYSALTFPHLALTQAGLMLLFVALRRLEREKGWRPWAAAGGSSLLVALIHPEQMAPALLAELLSGGVRRALRSAVAASPGLALAAWETLSAVRLPWVREWLARSDVGMARPVAVLSVLAVPAVLAAAGFAAWARGRKREEVVRVAAWALAPAVLICLPLPPGAPDHRERFFLALAPWLWLFAAAGSERLRPAVVRAAVAAVLLAGPAAFVVVVPATLPPGDRVAFVPRDVAAAYEWIGENARGETVLADRIDANRLPPRALARPVLVGHWAETPGFSDGKKLAEEFFAPSTPAGRRAEIVKASGARWVLWRSDLYGPAGLEGTAELAWRAGAVEIWKVR